MKHRQILRRGISVLLSLLLCLTLLPMTVLAAGTETADFTSGDGSAALALLNDAKTEGAENSTWDSTTKTLTLNGVNFTTTNPTAMILPAGATINLVGENTITSTNSDTEQDMSFGILAVGNLTIEGDGTLTVTGGATDGSYGSRGIYAYGTVKIEGGTVNANGGGNANSSVAIEAGTVEIKAGTVTATGRKATSDSTGIYAGVVAISGGTVTATGDEATNDYSYGISAHNDVTISGGDVTATASTAPVRSYGIYIEVDYDYSNGQYVTAGNIIISGGHVTAQAEKAALNKEPTLSDDYYWRTNPVGGFTSSAETAYKYDETTPHTYVEFFQTVYTVTAYGCYGTTYNGQTGIWTYAAGNFVELPVGARDGYTLKGLTLKGIEESDLTWNDITADNNGQRMAFFTMPANNVTVTVIWEKTDTSDNTDTPDIPYIPNIPQNTDKTDTIQDGWVEENGNWYYYTDNAAETGWQKIGGTWYYLDPRSGAMAESGMQEIDGEIYYFYDWGGMASYFWYLDEEGDWYYFGGNGAMVENKWVLCGGKWYYLGSDGAMVENKWILTNGVWYYLGSDGAMLTNQWLYWNGAWYYLGADGAMLTDTVTPDGYYVGKDGVWVK